MDDKIGKMLAIWAVIFMILVVVLFSVSTYLQSIRTAYLTLDCNGEKVFSERPIDSHFNYEDVKCDNANITVEVR